MVPGRAEPASRHLLVLASPDDRLALGVARRWRERLGAGSLTLLAPEALALAPGLQLRIDRHATEAAFLAPDGAPVRLSGPEGPSAILNRWDAVPEALFAGWSETDRTYGLSEFHAFLVAFLKAPCGRMANRPSVQWAAGPAFRPIHWAALARQAGLEPADMFETSSSRSFPAPAGAHVSASGLALAAWDRPQVQATAGDIVEAYVVGDRVVGGPAGATADALVRLAGSAGVAFCCVSLLPRPWRFLAFDPFPPSAPAPVLDALCDWLSG